MQVSLQYQYSLYDFVEIIWGVSYPLYRLFLNRLFITRNNFTEIILKINRIKKYFFFIFCIQSRRGWERNWSFQNSFWRGNTFRFRNIIIFKNLTIQYSININYIYMDLSGQTQWTFFPRKVSRPTSNPFLIGYSYYLTVFIEFLPELFNTGFGAGYEFLIWPSKPRPISPSIYSHSCQPKFMRRSKEGHFNFN